VNKKEFIEDYAMNAYIFHKDPEGFLVAKLIFNYMRGKNVLDLGCGPVHHILSLFFRDAVQTTAVDLHQENLDFIKKCKKNSLALPCQISAISYLYRYLLKEKHGKSQEILIKENYNKIKRLIQANVLTRIEDFKTRFDSVMQIGCFGALNTLNQYRLAVSHSACYIRPGGTLLMVNWLQPNFMVRPYSFNGRVSSVLDKKEYGQAVIDSGLMINMLKTTTNISVESKMHGYDKMIYLVAHKKNGY
jgi:cyclopropane fatty-acyl-phospholipid synthase-like methyltransferase